jgi:hypothetical protein
MLSDRENLEIRAILDLKAARWTEEEIRRLLGFSMRTLYRRKAQEREFRRHKRPMAVLPVSVAG